MPKIWTRFRTGEEKRARFPGVSIPDTVEDRRTKQEFRDECDVNNIMKKYLKTGQLPELIKSNPKYGDFSDVPSFQEAQDRVNFANAQFAALPARVRARFENDPAQFLAFASDERNAQELIDMKLATPRPPADSLAPQGGSQEPRRGAVPAPSRGAPKGKPQADDSEAEDA